MYNGNNKIQKGELAIMHEENGQHELHQLTSLEELHKAFYASRKRSFDEDQIDDDDADCCID